ncbi:kinase, pfkB family protein [Histomonas meleagridis]|uniref:kinase, pfkB family protein n=1 Tax=Histomonas meleagridis TaxID=135588 RepID=UPI00355A92CA|nr:kinase, pfkB family protein [Histomonas meleagridis]KAH0797514.1 kinase, pfkB family protein [Histomonas meleagridis]
MTTVFAGICSIDLYSKCDRLPNLGETLKGNELNRGYGGKASNACAQYAFLAGESHKPSLLTCVGNDSDGKEILFYFNKININNEMVQTLDNVPTGLAICFVLDKGESAIVIHPCNPTKEMIIQNSEKLSKSKYLVTNFEMPVEVTAEALKIAHEGGSTTILNAAPIPANLDKNIFKNVTIAIVNKVELEALGNVDELFGYGVQLVVVTLGSDGADLYQKDKEKIHVASPKVNAIDTTGAGDSFLGSFSYCISMGMGYEEAAKFACICASISVQGIGTQQSYAHADHPQLKPILPK